MKLDLHQPLTDLDGQPVNDQQGRPIHLSTAAQQALLGGNTDQPVRAWGLAQSLHKGEPFEANRDDLDFIETQAKSAQGLSVAAKAQLLIALKRAKGDE